MEANEPLCQVRKDIRVSRRPGSYLGPYPTPDEAKQLLETHGRSVDIRELEAGRIRLCGKGVRLSSTDLTRMRLRHDTRKLDVALVHGTCLLVGETAYGVLRIDLIDLGGFGWFASYPYLLPRLPRGSAGPSLRGTR